MGNLGYAEDSDREMETTISTFKADDGMTKANPEHSVVAACGSEAFANPLYESTSSLAAMAGPKAIANPLHKSARTVQIHRLGVPEASTNPLNQSASGLTVVDACGPEAFANPLYGSASRLAVVAGPKAIVNPLYKSVNTVTGMMACDDDIDDIKVTKWVTSSLNMIRGKTHL